MPLRWNISLFVLNLRVFWINHLAGSIYANTVAQMKRVTRLLKVGRIKRIEADGPLL